MEEQVAAALTRLFEDQRIVFWDDSQGEWADRLATLAPAGVIVAQIANDEFGWKYRMLRGEPRERFLVYRRVRPEDTDNWLLDIELGAATFSPDPAAIWATELGLPADLAPVLKAHDELLRARARAERLKARLRGREDARGVRLAMLETAAGADGGLAGVLEALLAERATGRDEAERLIARSGLADFLWDEVRRAHGYQSSAPSVADYAVALFEAAWARATGVMSLTDEAWLFFRNWSANRHQAQAFEALSRDAEQALGIEEAAARQPLETLGDVLAFEAVDRQVIRLLAAAVAERTCPAAAVAAMLERRRKSHWWDRYCPLYDAIGHAAAFGDALAGMRFDMVSMADGVRRYATSWNRIDALYRRFTRSAQTAGQVGLTGPLSDAVEHAYVDGFLLKLGDAWQAHVDAAERWEAGDVPLQRHFYDEVVNDYRRRGLRVAVIVSDALRYEVAAELGDAVRRVDRFEAELSPMLGVLPSYTQLGMAALLPHRELAIRTDGSGLVLADGRPTAGLEARGQILAAGARTGDRTAALKAVTFMEMGKDDARSLVRDHDVLFLYHDRIDAIGDKTATEAQTFEACADTIDDIERLVRKLAGANATHMVVTADHGFLYQHRALGEGEYLSEAPAGAEILDRNRRFVVGTGLAGSHGLRHFSAAAIGLAGETEVLLPKSINRLRRQGSGSRFVHGGATLQEVVVPVLRVAKGRRSDVETVEVDVVSLPKTVTSGQFSATLFQEAPVSDKVRPRRLRLGVWSDAGELLSETHELPFDRTDLDPRARETAIRFLLSKAADAQDGQEVSLRLEELHGDTSRWRIYRQARFRLRRAMSNDFDF